MKKFLAVLAVAFVGALVFSAPASATEEYGVVTATHYGKTCGQVKIKFTNTTEWTFSADIKIDDHPGSPDQWSEMEIEEGPLAGQTFGNRYRPVSVPPGVTERIVKLPEDSGTHKVRYRVARGPEQMLYVDWSNTIRIKDTNCQADPEPSPSETDVNPSPSDSVPPPSTSPSASESGVAVVPTTPTSDAGNGGNLPVTGASLPLLVGGALALILAGGTTLFLVRRRKLATEE